MVPEEAKKMVHSFVRECETIYDITKTASRNNQSLNGNGFYANKFRNMLITLAKSEGGFRKVIDGCHLDAQVNATLFDSVGVLKSTGAQLVERTAALQNIRLQCNSVVLLQIENMTASPVPMTEQVLPQAVVQGTRGYLEKIVIQANGAYEHQWYDACSVMVRKLVEILIIELYETKGRASDIKDASGEFLTLRDLVTIVSNDSSWSLGRETKRTLPMLKELGDRSAHTRRYLANKTDVDKVISGLRVVVDEFLHLSGLK
jgi:hypothetical protein